MIGIPHRDPGDKTQRAARAVTETTAEADLEFEPEPEEDGGDR